VARRKRHSFTTGRRYSPVFVFTQTVRTTCFPVGSEDLAGNNRLTVPVSHVPLGAFWSTMSTRSPTWTLRLFQVHFRLSINEGTYSVIQRHENRVISSCACLQRLRDSGPSSSNKSGGMCGWARP
jgi:hypothetical protein